MGELYKLDFPNGKSYIGISIHTAAKRFVGHKRSAIASVKGVLYNAWRKHGDPTLTVLAVMENSELAEAEIQAIIQHNTLHPNGYNISTGGDISPMTIPSIREKVRAALSIPEGKAKRIANWKATMLDPARKARWLRSIRESQKRPEVSLKKSISISKAWKNPDIRDKQLQSMRTPAAIANRSKATKERFANPAELSKHSKKMKQVCNTPEGKAKASAISKKSWKDPEVTARRIAAIKAAHQNPELKERMRKIGRQLASDPRVTAKRSASHKKNWADPKKSAKRRAALSAKPTRAKMSASAKARWNDPVKGKAARAYCASAEFRAKARVGAQRRATPEYREKMRELTRKSWIKRRKANARVQTNQGPQ